MKIKELLDRLFHRKSINSIVLLGSLVELPTRDEIKDEEIVKELDQYKKEYIDILSHKKVFVSKDLEDNFMHEVMRNTDLLLRTMQPNQMEELYFIDTDKEEVEQLRHQVSLCKLNTYYETTKQLEQEMILRSVALTEISNEIFFFSSFKKNALKEELNHLGASIQMLRSQRKGIMLEASSYLSNVNTTSNSSIKEQKLELLRSMMQIYFPSFQEEGEEIKNIATLENRLEVYFYDKEKYTLLHEKEEALLLTYSNESEIKLWAMAIYGKDLVTEADLTQFYEAKFNYWSEVLFSYQEKTSLSNDIQRDKNLEHVANQISKLSSIKKYFYAKIVESKVSNLLNGRLSAYTDILDPHTTAIAISRYLKGKNKTFDSMENLTNSNKLLFILSFEKEGRIEDYFRWHYHKTGSEYSMSDHHGISLQEDIFITDDKNHSLELLYFLEYVNSNAQNPSSLGSNYLYPIYYMLRKRKESIFEFPENVKELNVVTRPFTISSKKWLKNMRTLSNRKNLVISPGMKIIGPIFDHMKLKNVFLGDKCKISETFSDCQIQNIYCSCEPKIIDSFQNTHIGTIQLSSIQSKGKLAELLCNFYQPGRKYYYYGVSYNLKEEHYLLTPCFEFLCPNKPALPALSERELKIDIPYHVFESGNHRKLLKSEIYNIISKKLRQRQEEEEPIVKVKK